MADMRWLAIHWRLVYLTVWQAIALSVLITVLGAFIPPGLVLAQPQPESGQAIRLLVDFKGSNDQLIPDSQIRSEIRHIRRLSRLTPSRYRTASGDVRQAEDLRRWQVIEVAAEQADTLYDHLQHNPAIAEVHFENIYQAALLPNDPQLGQQYAFSPPDSLGAIKADQAWQKTTGSPNTIIAIIDGGVDISHEDLQDKLWQNSREIAGNNNDDDGNGFIDDIHGWDFVGNRPAQVGIDHATHVAGMAAASSNNGRGVAGVDWQARIMSVRVLSAQGLGGEENIINGISYAVANGATVINLSIVGSASPALGAAIENAYAAGVVVVAAVGNSGADTGRVNPFPACADNHGMNMVVGVAATDEAGEPASFSNWGKCVDISAPGKKILSSKTGNRYGEMTGTSMSSPFVAGAAGLYRAAFPLASVAETIQALTEGDPFTGRKTVEWTDRFRGRLNLARVVQAELILPSISPLPTTSVGPPVSPTGLNDPSSSPIPSVASAPAESGGGGSDGGGGGGGGGGDESQPTPVPRPPRVAGAKQSVNVALLGKIKPLFALVFGRQSTSGEYMYWTQRVKKGDKKTEAALHGAMQWQRLHKGKSAAAGIKHLASPKLPPAQLNAQLDTVFKSVYQRSPNTIEKKYWQGRILRKEKVTVEALRGAIQWQKLKGK